MFVFPVSVSQRPYRGIWKGNGCFFSQIEALGAVDDSALIFEVGKRFTQSGGPDPADLSQLLDGNGPIQLSHGLKDAVAVTLGAGLSCRIGFGRENGGFIVPGFCCQSQSRTVGQKLNGDIVLARGGAVFDRKQQVRAAAAQVQI